MFSCRADLPKNQDLYTAFQQHPKYGDCRYGSGIRWGDKKSTFNIALFGHRGLQDFEFLIPDHLRTTKPLAISDLNIEQYTRRFSRLTPEERLAIREWSLCGTPKDPAARQLYYSDAQPVPHAGYDAFHIGRLLSNENRLNSSEENAINLLSDALSKLPPVWGELVGVLPYGVLSNKHSPWGSAIKVGDVVSEGRFFTQLTSSLSFFEEALTVPGALKWPDIQTLVVRKIFCPEHLSGAVPLVQGLAAAPNYGERHLHLLPRGSCFRVESIATVDTVRAPAHRWPDHRIRRVGVILTQIRKEDAGQIKDMDSGQPLDMAAMP